MKKRYCSDCGSEMLEIPDIRNNWAKFRLPRFNSETGEKISYEGINYKCPNERIWNLHDNYFVLN